jgi:oligoendopeptidase F
LAKFARLRKVRYQDSILTEELLRADVPAESTWNAESVFAGWDPWQAELEALSAEISEHEKYAGKLTTSPATLADWLELFTGQRRRLMRLLIYARMKVSVDSADMTAKGNLGLVMGAVGRFSGATAFAEPEMLALGVELTAWSRDEPRLAIYSHYFDDLLLKRAHRRSAEVEEILGLLAEPFAGAQQMASELTNADLRFADAVDGQGERRPVAQGTPPPTGIDSPDRALRRSAWASYSDAHLAMKNTLAAAYVTSVKQNVLLARVRGYGSVLESRLSPYNIPVEVFHNFIDTFQANLPTWHRYWEIKRQALGVDAIHPYDIWAPLSRNQPEISYSQAIDWIGEGLAPLGDEYVDVLRRGCLEERWVDYAPNSGKAQGAFSNPSYDTHPFIFMRYENSLMDLSILAHELGHSMHGYLTNKHQPEIYNGYTLISSTVAETASNFHQALVRAYLTEAKAGNAPFQLALIEEAIFNFHRYFFIMPTLARFEWEVYSRAEQGQPLTADILNGIMSDLFAEGYGSTLADDPERTGITWSQFVHIYMPFYSFQYGVGISAAHALADAVRAGDEQARQDYLSFLSAGGSMYATDLFELAGVDMSRPEPVEMAFEVLAGFVDRLEQLVSEGAIEGE